VVKLVPIDWVRVEGRTRADLGDIGALAESIRQLGIITTIIVTPDGRLISGLRRLEAFKKLGWPEIPVRIVHTLEEASEHMEAECGDTCERKEMNLEETGKIGLVLETLGRKALKHEARTLVGKALGMSGTSYGRVKMMLLHDMDVYLPAEERAITRKAIERMNLTGEVAPGYHLINSVRKKRQQPNGQTATVTDPKVQRHALNTAASTLSGVIRGLEALGDIHPSITNEELAQWLDELSRTRRDLASHIRRLKERSA